MSPSRSTSPLHLVLALTLACSLCSSVAVAQPAADEADADYEYDVDADPDSVSDYEYDDVADEAQAQASAATSEDGVPGDSAEPGENAYKRGGEIAFDSIVLRPPGAVASGVGFVFFVASTPFVAPTMKLSRGWIPTPLLNRQGVADSWDHFVTTPVDDTFRRPIGEI